MNRMAEKCPKCGVDLNWRLGAFECPGCGYTAKKADAGDSQVSSDDQKTSRDPRFDRQNITGLLERTDPKAGSIPRASRRRRL